MIRTAQARRSNTAAAIIRDAYRTTRPNSARKILRYELLGSSVALAVWRDEHDSGLTSIRVARRLGDGRAVQMRKESRTHFSTLNEFLAYFDRMYARYGAPRD
jgi:hypothetical protein